MAAALLLAALAGARVPADETVTGQVRDAIVARQTTIENVIVHFDSEVIDTPDGARVQALLKVANVKREVVTPEGSQRHTQSFSALAGRSRFEREMTDETAKDFKARQRPG